MGCRTSPIRTWAISATHSTAESIQTQPQFKAADAYCSKRYLFHTVSPAQKARWNGAAVKYSACMRAHGARDFPDPDGTGAIYFPTAEYYRTPKALRAEGACKSLFIGKGFVFVSPAP